jgi:probable F420-dependent oxidoreductase
VNLAGTGLWSGELRYGDPQATGEAAAELDELGYKALWIPDISGDVFTPLNNLLAATKNITIATGILNLWMTTPKDAAEGYAAAVAEHGDRLMIGIGVSHQLLIDGAKAPGTYEKPLTAMREFLDGLDAQPNDGIPQSNRMLAALGPKMLELAATRTRGTHPYLITPEYTARIRETIGDGPLIAAEQGVILETDPEKARTIGREALAGYLMLENYTNHMKRFGFTDDDVANGGSDRLVDALIAWGDEDTIAERVTAHYEAGADHVCVQVLRSGSGIGSGATPLEEWRRLAPALLGASA